MLVHLVQCDEVPSIINYISEEIGQVENVLFLISVLRNVPNSCLEQKTSVLEHANLFHTLLITVEINLILSSM
jgi:hypothetical protein